MSRWKLGVEERLDEKISEIPEAGCWIWTACLNQSGYGVTYVEGRTRLAHIAVFELHRGPVPRGLQLDHLCRVRSCVNPWHLEPVSQRENIRRQRPPIGDALLALGRRERSKTSCPRGHAYDEANTRICPDGSRVCRACHRLSEATTRGRRS